MERHIFVCFSCFFLRVPCVLSRCLCFSLVVSLCSSVSPLVYSLSFSSSFVFLCCPPSTTFVCPPSPCLSSPSLPTFVPLFGFLSPCLPRPVFFTHSSCCLCPGVSFFCLPLSSHSSSPSSSSFGCPFFVPLVLLPVSHEYRFPDIYVHTQVETRLPVFIFWTMVVKETNPHSLQDALFQVRVVVECNCFIDTDLQKQGPPRERHRNRSSSSFSQVRDGRGIPNLPPPNCSLEECSVGVVVCRCVGLLVVTCVMVSLFFPSRCVVLVVRLFYLHVICRRLKKYKSKTTCSVKVPTRQLRQRITGALQVFAMRHGDSAPSIPVSSIASSISLSRFAPWNMLRWL